jgi:hypothetical protein
LDQGGYFYDQIICTESFSEFAATIFSKHRAAAQASKRKRPCPHASFCRTESRELDIAIPLAIAPGALEGLMNYGWPMSSANITNFS